MNDVSRVDAEKLESSRPRVFGYVRSTVAPQKAASALLSQEEEIRSYCEAEGLDLVALFTDTSPGTEPRKPELERLIELSTECQTPVQAVVACSRDRISRSTEGLKTVVARLSDANVQYLFVR